MSDTDKDNQSESGPVDPEKLLTQARMALKTGISAYENENYVFSETLFVKALDLFEQAGKLDEKEYFQCLHQVADTYFRMGRYFEAKSYYERLSVARLKNPDSTDAQVVVALLKLASTYEKLGEAAEALTAFDLIMDLAEKTIPNGHALFGVIFDSYEDVIARQIIDPVELAKREETILQKRDQFGFSKTSTEARWAHAVTPGPEEASENDNVLSQAPDQLRSSLKAWTHADMINPEAALGEAVQRTNQERLSSLQAREQEGERPREEVTERKVQAHLHPDMFRRKPPQEKDKDRVAIVAGGGEEGEGDELDAAEIDSQTDRQLSVKAVPVDKAALRKAKQLDTDKKRFNPMPALTVIGCLLAVGIAVFVAYEYAKHSTPVAPGPPVAGGLDYSGNSWVSSDGRKMLRCLTSSDCEYTESGVSVNGVYEIKGQPAADGSVLNGLFNGNSTKLPYEEVPGGLKASDGTVLYSESSRDHEILTKAQAIANFATFYFASRGHLYPGAAEDFQFGNAHFAWENPISGQVNPPIVKKILHTKADFESSFFTELKSLRDCKPYFDSDTATGSPAGLIECLALIPSVASADSTTSTPTAAATAAVDEAGCAFLVRAYDSAGKLICSSDPKKAFVIVLKNGISIDPIKALHEESAAAAPPQGKIDVVITPLPTGAAAKKSDTK